MELSEKDIDILLQAARYIDEVYVDDRKGVSQTYYVILVANDSTYFKGHSITSVPKHLVGYWRQKFAEDNRYESWQEQILNDPSGWVKCKPIEKVITTTEWKPL